MPLKIPYYEMDIPRLVTALADWLACLLYLRFLPPRYGGVKRAALYGGALAALALYLVATDGFDGWRFNVLYAVSVALMLLFMAAATRADRWQVGYFCTRAFILAGFAGALTWQMYVYFARYIAALQSLPALVLFIAAGFGIIFGLMWLLEDGGSTGSIQFDIRPRTTCIAAVMALPFGFGEIVHTDFGRHLHFVQHQLYAAEHAVFGPRHDGNLHNAHGCLLRRRGAAVCISIAAARFIDTARGGCLAEHAAHPV